MQLHNNKLRSSFIVKYQNMKNATIFHGTAGSPDHFWFPYLKEKLENDEYKVWLPQLPDADLPDIHKWLSYALENGNYSANSVLIGHSAGCPLILSLLENIDLKIHQAILVSGFIKPLDDDPEPVLQETYNWKSIKNRCNKFYFINSDNDPWGCDDKAGRAMFDNLGGELLIRHGEGHMGSDSFNQPYKEFPLVYHLIKAEEVL